MTDCPASQRFEQFLAGQLSSADEEAFCNHIEECAACRGTLDNMTPLFLSLDKDECATSEPAVSDFLDGLKETDPKVLLAEEEANDSLFFFQPSSQEGHLGRLDHYEVLSVIGRGGMGVVFKAFDEKLRRIVAVKMLSPQLAASATARQRFLREARAAAAVSHDHVVAVYAVEDNRGIPYLVMPCIEGTSLEDKIKTCGALDVKQILRIGLQVAEGLAAAHKQGLIHRDVKPANILLENGVERVKLTDFGLARAASDVSLTHSWIVAGTPQFMAPEQARGEVVDHRADLFALGSVLYMMCTGQPPFRADTAMAVLKRVCEDTPCPIRDINPDIPPWLTSLIGRLHAKEPAHRLPSAVAVAELLSKYLAKLQQPRVEDSQTELEPKRKSGVRRRRKVVAGGLLLAALILFVTAWRWHTGTQGKATISDSEVQSQPLPLSLRRPGPPSPLDGRLRSDIPAILLELAGRGDPQFAPQELVAVLGTHRFRQRGPVSGLAYSLDGKRLAVSTGVWHPQLGRFLHSSIAIREVPSGRILHTLEGHTGAVVALAFSPDGQLLATASRDRTAKIWEVETGKDLLTLRGHTDLVRAVAFSPDGKLLATAGADHKVILWDAARGEQQRTFEKHTGQVVHVTFSPDGSLVASTGSYSDSHVRIWETATAREIVSLACNNEAARGVAFSPDGKRLVSISDHSVCQVWDVAAGKELFHLHGHGTWVLAVAWSGDGKHIVTCSRDQTVRIWDARNGRELRQCVGGIGIPSCLALSGDGKRVVVGSEDGLVRFWRLADGQELEPAEGHRGQVQSVAFSRDGQLLGSAGRDHTVKLWDLAGWQAGQPLPPLRTLRQHTDTVWSLAFSPDGKRLASLSADRTIVLWEAGTGRQLRSLTGQSGGESILAFSPDGRTLAAGQEDGQVKLWDADTGQALAPVRGHALWVRAVAFSPDGRLLASAGVSDETVRVVEVAGGRLLHTFRPKGVPMSVAFSPDGRTLAAGTAMPDGAVHLWDLAGIREQRVLHGHTGHVTTLAFQPGSQLLASGSQDGKVHLWNLGAVDKQVHVIGPEPFGKSLAQVAFTPDGRYLAAANENGTIPILKMTPP